MAWMTRLYETYENLSESPDLLKACKMPLVPLAHTVQTAHVDVALSISGDFIRAECVPAETAMTVVPCTEDSAGRSSGAAPHMLFDNLKYTAGDAQEYNADPKTADNYEAYCEQLGKWCDDDDCPDFVKAVYRYVIKGRLIHDLENSGILSYGSGKLKWNGSSSNKPSGEIWGVFVKFSVFDANGEEMDVEPVMKAYAEYDRARRDNIRTCYATGKKSAVTYKHPAKIRYSGDSARLISSNDKSGYTFRGRYRLPEDAVGVGYEVSHKAHSALRWLIANQAFKVGDKTVIVWSVGTNDIPDVMGDSVSFFGEDEPDKFGYTSLETYAKNVELAVNSYAHSDLDVPVKSNMIVIMILEGATPGRLSISYYRELTDFDYLENIKSWHKSCVWNHSYRYIKEEIDQENGKKKEARHYIKYTGAPSIPDIISAVYGPNVDDKLKKKLVEILIACVAERKKIPYEIIMKGVARVSAPEGMEEWDISKSTSIVCALIRKYYYDKGEVIDMALDRENNDRSYLFGRALAYAERIESYANYLAEEKRVPNARKYRSKFRTQPARTWAIIDDKLEPYIERLYKTNKSGLVMKWYSELQDIISRLSENEFMDSRALDPKYLLGYAAQMTEFGIKKQTELDSENEEDKIESVED